jgi:hypothetical protein
LSAVATTDFHEKAVNKKLKFTCLLNPSLIRFRPTLDVRPTARLKGN